MQFVCGQEAPEDLLHLPGSDWVIASSMAGNGGIRFISVRGKTSTLLYPSTSAKEQLDRKTYDTCPGAPEPGDKAKFTTHGLAMRTVRNSIYTLYAIRGPPWEKRIHRSLPGRCPRQDPGFDLDRVRNRPAPDWTELCRSAAGRRLCRDQFFGARSECERRPHQDDGRG